MLGTILGIGIPLLYLHVMCIVARWTVQRINASDSSDRVLGAGLIGVFWPVAFPLYYAIRLGNKAIGKEES